ncbi:MAG: glycoside hydrolase family 3 protein [Novosphingobium sp.]
MSGAIEQANVRNRRKALAGAISALALAATMFAPGAPAQEVHPERWPAAQSPRFLSPQDERRIDALLAAMTVEEKVGQMIQADIGTITPEDLRTYPLGSVLAGGSSGPFGNDRSSAADWKRLADAFRAVSLERRAGRTAIPVIFGVDGVHGHNNVPGAVIFPHNIGLGAMRDPALAKRVAQAAGEEIAATGIDWTFAPTLAVPQDVRWGRTYEGFSERSEVVGAYAGPVIEGLQGMARTPADRILLAATAKHFIGDGGTTDGADQGNADISEAQLIEPHASGYVPAIQAGVLTVMASYSSWQGTKMHVQKRLLTDVLKGRMGFAGFVVGDWNGHGQVPGCTNDSCPQAINAGIDMFMVPANWKALYRNTLAQVRSGEIPAARVDDAVRRILRVKAKLGLFDPQPPARPPLSAVGADAHKAVAREAVRESLVLLKNDGILPLKPGQRVLVAGEAANSLAAQMGGWTITWQGTDTAAKDFPAAKTTFRALRENIVAGGGTADLSPDGAWTTKPDVAVVVFGEEPYAEMQGDRKTAAYQSRNALRTLQQLKAQGIPTVSVFLSGRPLWVTPEIEASNAFVAAWLPGSEGGTGLADVLLAGPSGRASFDFTGKLPFSWPASPLPRRAERPLYDFGYGLSYSSRAEPRRRASDAK